MDAPDEPAVTHAMCVIARYLRDNPHASDTVEGIWRWWLATTDVDLAVVQLALDRLAEARIVDVHAAADGSRRFRRAAAPEAAASLRALAGTATPGVAP